MSDIPAHPHGLRPAEFPRGVEVQTGYFHRWITHLDGEIPGYMGTYLYAIVELPNGEIVQVEPDGFRFLDVEGAE